jgi:hypothetical protein
MKPAQDKRYTRPTLQVIFPREWEAAGGWKIEPRSMATRLYNALSERAEALQVDSFQAFAAWPREQLSVINGIGHIGLDALWPVLHPNGANLPEPSWPELVKLLKRHEDKVRAFAKTL